MISVPGPVTRRFSHVIKSKGIDSNQILQITSNKDDAKNWNYLKNMLASVKSGVTFLSKYVLD